MSAKLENFFLSLKASYNKIKRLGYRSFRRWSFSKLRWRQVILDLTTPLMLSDSTALIWTLETVTIQAPVNSLPPLQVYTSFPYHIFRGMATPVKCSWWRATLFLAIYMQTIKTMINYQKPFLWLWQRAKPSGLGWWEAVPTLYTVAVDTPNLVVFLFLPLSRLNMMWTMALK